jgi:hypothetical protein
MTMLARSRRSLAVASVAALPALFALGCGGDDDNGVVPPPTTTTVTSVTVTPTSVVGGTAVQGTVTVNPAPSSAVTVALSSNNAAATVPASATVNAGATSGTFTITTAAVAAATAVSITATLNATSQSTTLTVTPQGLTASFTVSALSDVKRKLNTDPAPVTILPAGTLDACPLVNANFDCVFNGSGSVPAASVQQYIWTYFVGARTRVETSNTPVYKPSESSCNFFGGIAPSSSGGVQFIGMRVDLQVRDTSGALSAVASSQNIRIFPAGQCGYGF